MLRQVVLSKKNDRRICQTCYIPEVNANMDTVINVANSEGVAEEWVVSRLLGLLAHPVYDVVEADTAEEATAVVEKPKKPKATPKK